MPQEQEATPRSFRSTDPYSDLKDWSGQFHIRALPDEEVVLSVPGHSVVERRKVYEITYQGPIPSHQLNNLEQRGVITESERRNLESQQQQMVRGARA